MKINQTEDCASEWFLAQTSGQAERLAKAHLERQGFTAYLPMRASLSKATAAQRATPFLPRYVFVAVDPARPRWHDIVATPGISSLVRRAGAMEPARMPAVLVDAIKAREVFGLVLLAPKADAAKPRFRMGDAVRVEVPMKSEDGFSAFDALFDHVIDARRVAVLMTFADRMVRVEVAARRVHKAA